MLFQALSIIGAHVASYGAASKQMAAPLALRCAGTE